MRKAENTDKENSSTNTYNIDRVNRNNCIPYIRKEYDK